MEEENELLVHYWQLPEELFVSLKDEFHNRLCNKVQAFTGHYYKNCFYKVLNCPKWHAQRLFTKFNRMTIRELEILREFTNISREEIEINIDSLGNHEDGTIIINPKLPFHLKNIFYVASHLMFDGSFRNKKGGYFYAHTIDLVEYHKNRLNYFGEVPINFITNENQLYFSHTIGYIASKILEIQDFRSLKVFLSEKFKNLTKQHKILLDEFVKAMIIDEGAIDDKIRIELGDNERLIRDIYEVVSRYYPLNPLSSRIRDRYFLENRDWDYKNKKSWKIEFKAISFTLLYKSISPLPIGYKQRSLDGLNDRANRKWFKRRNGETKRLIVKSLLNESKSVLDLSYELYVQMSIIRAHLKTKPNINSSLIGLGIIGKVDEIVLPKGCYSKTDIYGIIDKKKAEDYIKS